MSDRYTLLRTTMALALVTGFSAACGGGAPGSPAGNNVPHPVVVQFSPTMSPINTDTGQANPTYTDGALTVNTDPAYPGKICVFFQNKTKIDPRSVFIGGNPALGIDLSSIQFLQYIPGTGNIPLLPAVNGVEVRDDRILFTPATLPLPDGQYSVGIFANLKSVEGDPVDRTPVFTSFTVGAADTIAPIVVTTVPVNGASGVGAGAAPPAPQAGQTNVADVRTKIFGPTSPDIIIRFSESISSATVSTNTIQVVDAGAFIPGGGAPPAIAPAPGFPKLKSLLDSASLPSNGFEIVWRADPTLGGLPFGTQVQVTVIGSDGGVNTAPIKDRSDNALLVSYVFQFQTVAPPNLPVNPEPEYGIYWSASDRVGVIDTINQKEIALTVRGIQTTPIIQNVLADQNDRITTKANLGLSFDPLEISVDSRTDGVSCHTFAYIQSFQSGQIVVMNTRTSLPVALINTPSPGGLSNQTGGGQAANVLVATNSSANTFTAFDINNIRPGLQVLTGPIFVSEVSPTGNTPKAISITAPVNGAYNREYVFGGPGIPVIFITLFTDGVLTTTNLGTGEAIKQFALGSNAFPNDISVSACFQPSPVEPVLMYAAVSEGGSGIPGDGKVTYYTAGPGCGTGLSNNARPDSLTGELAGFDAPAGLDEIFTFSATGAFFALAESGSTKNQLVTLGMAPSTTRATGPRIIREFKTGANPVAVAHRPSVVTPAAAGRICILGQPLCPTKGIAFTPPPCWYYGTEQVVAPFSINFGGSQDDNTGNPSVDLYVCARGAGRVDVIDSVSGSKNFYSPVSIPGVRYVASTASQ